MSQLRDLLYFEKDGPSFTKLFIYALLYLKFFHVLIFSLSFFFLFG